ncbi:hypothetical protein Kpho02_57760 [Kitasatospora phosalacinea]|uniref:DUF3040 domain-containing protein n=1 Tax=Kitasatospora phosalacinea TaxID=2065 RepID=A0A9W6QAZ7_9ACTN|nr:hypothetical protein [Kitasatospora phosalacinea]GLW73477.1 hypothetical protein Kpho02_57760 [Kitasatospora phosalacinea]
MDGATLSPRERHLLAALEAELRVDVELDLRLRTMRHHQVRALLGPPCRALLAALLVLAAAVAEALRLTRAGLVLLAATAARAVRPSPGGPGRRRPHLP